MRGELSRVTKITLGELSEWGNVWNLLCHYCYQYFFVLSILFKYLLCNFFFQHYFKIKVSRN